MNVSLSFFYWLEIILKLGFISLKYSCDYEYQCRVRIKGWGVPKITGPESGGQGPLILLMIGRFSSFVFLVFHQLKWAST